MLLLLTLVAQAQAGDPRVCALRERSAEGLRDICEKASIPCAGADAEAMRSLIYEKMQGEIPGNTEVKPWPGPGEPGECKAAVQQKATPTPEQPAQQEDSKQTVHMAAMLFQKLDRDADGKLTRAEMQSMVDNVNAAAKAKGEPEHDLFATLDQDKDSFVSKAEAEKVFASIMKGELPGGGGGAAKTATQPNTAADGDAIAASLFSNLDTDKDGRLSKTEFQSILSKMEAEAKQKGETPEDFWTSLDQNKDDYVDREEAKAFFAMMAAALAKGGGKDEL